MRLIFALSIFLFPFFAFAQVRSYSFNEIDERVKSIPFAAPETLSKELTAPYQTDREKVRAIFRWITENIEYNVAGVANRRSPSPQLKDDLQDDGPLKPLSERVALNVLGRGAAYCDGYARLFATLCDYAGIKAEVISGYANGGGRRLRFVTNHRWNAVYFDSAWHLLDVTWASGYINFQGEFVRSLNEKYWLSSPEEFALDHHPDDLQWTLTGNWSGIPEFNAAPFRTNAFAKNHISSYAPLKGVIEAGEGDTVRFEIRSLEKPELLGISDAAVIDSSVVAGLHKREHEDVQPVAEGNKIFINYIVSNANAQWLQVVYNDEVVLRYRLNVKKGLAKND